jgi:hypothetical protein
MKKILLVATAFAFGITVMAQVTKTKSQAPSKTQPTKETKTTEVKSQTLQVQSQISVDNVIKLNTETHDFGKIKQGVPVTYSFEIKNISDKPVVVENSWASCGCTTPEKIVEPILPNTTAKLKVQYNAAAVGPINKDVYIKIAGVEQTKTVKIVGEVVTAEAPKEEKK